MSTEKEYKAAREMPGVVKMYAGSAAPTGYLLCNGAAVSRTTYDDLFAVIGTTWGVGDSSTTFNIPDICGAAPAGVGAASGYTQTETIALGTKYDDQIQGHWHGQRVVSAAGGSTYWYYNTNLLQQGSATTDSFVNTLGPETDGTNGTPRTGTVTRGKRVGINFIIKT